MKDLYGNKMPLMSHRGVKSAYPENTLGAYNDAIKAGFEAIELDVVMSKNKMLYCSHNHDLELETDGFGYIPDLSDAEIDSCLALFRCSALSSQAITLTPLSANACAVVSPDAPRPKRAIV